MTPTDDQAAAALAADAQQAAYFRGFLERERATLQHYLAEHVARLTTCMTTGSMRLVGHHRRCIRTAENQIQSVNRMLARIDSRFPD